MKKSIFSSVILFALFAVCFWFTGCKVYEPCKSPAYKPNSDNTITGSEVVSSKDVKEMRLWMDFEKFFLDNGITVGPDDSFAVHWQGAVLDGIYIEEGNVLAGESECGWYVALPKYKYYLINIILKKNGEFESFDLPAYGSEYNCMIPTLKDGEIYYISALCIPDFML